MAGVAKLRDFVRGMTRLAEAEAAEERWVAEGGALLGRLVAEDDWLPEDYAIPGPSYRQYLLHCDPLERFCVVSFVWGPGQKTPLHDHLVWGLVGMLRGSEISTPYLPGSPMQAGEKEVLTPGQVAAVSPQLGDLHVVENAYADRASISIHCYGGNIGAILRHTYDPATGTQKRFISGYTNRMVPNLWDRSLELRPAQ
ncbi:cysteine dioxygenase [Siccirubricoccus sp. KC 17139]|uniref:Cysteine dioxygenase n=1 Tax=Siccirubricoccus soli TaxID=2899147 RepID=A0ABT1D129_9PROT|nr:cysteine dioxygenase [Siccirubricoccus soli]MCO6415608.1 cysteine dioxygenase [Siccirubricoccus soli]MCP2681740.1 cysteine dioxygenase [Siccirubricoccus soli]